MNTTLEYKDYPGLIRFGGEKVLLHERHEFRPVNSEGDNAKDPKAAFQEVVDDNPALCKSGGRKPDMTLKSSFNAHPGSGMLHRAMRCARRWGINLNTVVSDSLRRDPERGGPTVSDQLPQKEWAGHIG